MSKSIDVMLLLIKIVHDTIYLSIWLACLGVMREVFVKLYDTVKYNQRLKFIHQLQVFISIQLCAVI
jgi:hypothetical protein